MYIVYLHVLEAVQRHLFALLAYFFIFLLVVNKSVFKFKVKFENDQPAQ